MFKRIFLSILIASSATCLFAEEYSVEAIYEKVDVDRGTIAVDNYGNQREVDYLLVKTNLKSGKYEIELTRKELIYTSKQDIVMSMPPMMKRYW